MEADGITSIVFMDKSMLFDPQNFCRCCLKDDKSLMTMANIDQTNGSTLQSLYDSVCPATAQFDGQPKICKSCVSDLRMAFQFHQMCKQADAKLNEITPQASSRKSKKNKAGNIQEENSAFKPMKIKEEPVEHELFLSDSQIDAMPEVRIKEEPTVTDHIDAEKELATNELLNKESSDSGVPDDPVFCNYCNTSFANNKKLMQHFQKHGYPCKQPELPKKKTGKSKVCNCTPGEVKYIWIQDHKTLKISTYTKYHKIFFPDCTYTSTDTRSYCNNFKVHMKRHNTSYKQIYEYTIENGLQRDLIQAGLSKKPKRKPIIVQKEKAYEGSAFTCHHCGLTFGKRRRINEHFHIRPTTNNNQLCKGTWKGFTIYGCKDCGAKCRTKKAITAHRREVHNKKYFSHQCSRYFPNCDYKSNDFRNFNHHLIKRHNIKLKEISWRLKGAHICE